MSGEEYEYLVSDNPPRDDQGLYKNRFTYRYPCPACVENPSLAPYPLKSPPEGFARKLKPVKPAGINIKEKVEQVEKDLKEMQKNREEREAREGKMEGEYNESSEESDEWKKATEKNPAKKRNPEKKIVMPKGV
jgi:hypothetical protein